VVDETPKRRKVAPPQSIEQRIGAVLKSARDIMRKDRGLSGELDRLPMLTWIMLLKFLDDMERRREEEASIKRNFPEDKQTQETTLLFLQVIMRRLRRTPQPGRAAVVVPNGTLFADGIAARIKADLLNSFNLHTVVRLPNGVFAPYTDIPSNLLFFSRGGPTTSIWYYELPAPAGRKKYSKTAPMRDEDFADCLAWWSDRKENERAWRVPVEGLVRTEKKGDAEVIVACNLDVKNPRGQAQAVAQTPDALLAGIVEKEERILAILRELRASLGEGGGAGVSAHG